MNFLLVAKDKNRPRWQMANLCPMSCVLFGVFNSWLLPTGNFQPAEWQIKYRQDILRTFSAGKRDGGFWRRATKFSLLSAKLNVIVIFNFKCSTNGEKKNTRMRENVGCASITNVNCATHNS